MTAHDLLVEFLDYAYLWSSEDLKNAHPAVVRRKRLEALLQAFGLTKAYVNPLKKIMYGLVGSKEEVTRARHLDKLTNIDYFRQGEFLHDRAHEENRELIGLIIRTLKEELPSIPDADYEKRMHIGWLFNDLLRFRLEVYKLAYPWGGMDEGFSAGLYYSKILAGRLKAIINANTHEIDAALCLVIDPKKREFSKDELVRTYAYPDVDLHQIDHEWRVENW